MATSLSSQPIVPVSPQPHKLTHPRRKAFTAATVIILTLAAPTTALALNLGGISNILSQFGGVLENFGQIFNIPGIGNLTDLIRDTTGWIDRIDTVDLDDLPSILEDLGIDLPGLDLGELGDLIGDMGVIDPDDILDDLLKTIGKTDGSAPGEAAPLTPGVNPAIVAPVYANNALTESIIGNSISQEGQRQTAELLEGVNTAATGVGTIAEHTAESAQQLKESATSIAETTQSQTSTQDVLKSSMSGLVALEAANGAMLSAIAQQNSAMAQMQQVQTRLHQQTRDGVHATVQNLALVNQQLNQQVQREITQQNAALSDSTRSIQSGVRAMH